MQIFVASSFEDLKNYRAAATRAILTSGNLTKDMLFWAGQVVPPLEVSLGHVRSSDLLILLLAHRYGTPPDGESASITELEFREAVKRKIPVLAFSVEPDYPWPPSHVETDPVVRERLARFTKEVGKRVTIASFTSPESLEVAITNALASYVGQARQRAQPRYVQARARQVARPEALSFSTDAMIQIGRAPDGAALLLSITRHIRVEDDLAAIAGRLGKSLGDPAFKAMLEGLSQEAREFAATTGIYESRVNGSAGRFYVPDEPLTQQVAQSLLQSMLGISPATDRALRPATAPVSPYGPGQPPYGYQPQYGYQPPYSYQPPYAPSPLPATGPPGVPAWAPGPASSPPSFGLPALDQHSVESGRPFDMPSVPVAVSGFEPSGPEPAEPRVISVGGLNRFLCVALDVAPTTWSGGWAGGPYDRRELVIARPFIEEGLERLGGVSYVIENGAPGRWRRSEVIRTDQPDRYLAKWAELLSAADDFELSQMSYRITVPRSAIARFTLEVIEEVAELHDGGRLHGDIKPSNILVSRDGTLLIDDAHLSIGDISPTVTPGWSPSEQLLRQPLSPAADIFSLGLLLLHVLAAEPLGREVRFRMPGGLMAQIYDDPTVYIESGGAQAPVRTREDWCRLIERALRTDPEARFPSARAMAEEMRVLLDREELRGEIEIRLPWGDRPALVLDADGQPTPGWVIRSGHEKTLFTS